MPRKVHQKLIIIYCPERGTTWLGNKGGLFNVWLFETFEY